MAELGLHSLIGGAGYRSTRVLSALHSVGSLLLLKCSRRGRVANAFPLGADPGLGLPIPWWGGRRLRFGFPPR